MNAVVETRGLCKQYGPALRVNHLDLTVPEGAVYGFLGPNGAGKSTTLKLLLGLARPTAGEIAVFGRPMGPRTRMETLSQVGSLIESPSYYGHLTGAENLHIVQPCAGRRSGTSGRCCASSGWTARRASGRPTTPWA